MEVVGKVLINILPIVACIPIGYWLRRRFGWSAGVISKPLLYVVLPLVVIHKIAESEESKLAVLSCLSFLLAVGMNLPAYLVHRFVVPDEKIHFVRSTFTFYNVAFFGVPVISAMWGEDKIATLFCLYLGTAFYGDVIAYYEIARTKFNAKEAIGRVLKTPYIYTFAIAIGLKLFDFETPETVKPILDAGGWVASVAGMLIIGLSLDQLKLSKPLIGNNAKLLGIRAGAAVVIVGVLLVIEYAVIGQLESHDRIMLAMIPFFPISSNVSLFSAFLKTEEQKFATLVAMSVIASMIVVFVSAPFMDF